MFCWKTKYHFVLWIALISNHSVVFWSKIQLSIFCFPMIVNTSQINQILSFDILNHIWIHNMSFLFSLLIYWLMICNYFFNENLLVSLFDIRRTQCSSIHHFSSWLLQTSILFASFLFIGLLIEFIIREKTCTHSIRQKKLPILD